MVQGAADAMRYALTQPVTDHALLLVMLNVQIMLNAVTADFAGPANRPLDSDRIVERLKVFKDDAIENRAKLRKILKIADESSRTAEDAETVWG